MPGPYRPSEPQLTSTKQFDTFTSSTLWNLAYDIGPDEWDVVTPRMNVFASWGNSYGIMTTLSRAKLESLAELDYLLRSRPIVGCLTRLIELARGEPAKKQRLTCVDDIYTLRDRIQDHFAKRTLMTWSICGQMARRILVLLNASSFNELVKIINQNSLRNVCSGSLSEKAILNKLSNEAKQVELDNDPEDHELNTHPISLISKLLKYVRCRDELGVQRTIYKYFDYKSAVPKFNDHHHQGIIGLALAELELGRYEEAEVALSEALNRRTTSSKTLLNLMYNIHSDWPSMTSYARSSEIHTEVLKSLQPRCSTTSSFEIPIQSAHRQMIYTRAIVHFNKVPLFKLYDKLCSVWDENFIEKVTNQSKYMDQFNNAIQQLNWHAASNIANKTKYPIICKCAALMCRGDDLHKVSTMLETLDKDDPQVGMLKCILFKKVRHTKELPQHPYSCMISSEWDPKLNHFGCHFRQNLIQNTFSMGDEYTKYRCYFLWGWMLTLKENYIIRRHEALQFLKRAAEGFNSLGEIPYQAKSWFMAAKLANILNLIEERNNYSKEFRLLYEQMSESDRLLFI